MIKCNLVAIYFAFLVENLLKHRNLRVTPFRLDVLNIFDKHENAISLNQIEKELGRHDRITLYRTIKTFIKNGIVHEIPISNGDKHLALCTEDCNSTEHKHQHEHIHFQCKKCDEIFCVDINELPQIHLKNFIIENVEITAQGYCKHCAN